MIQNDRRNMSSTSPWRTVLQMGHHHPDHTKEQSHDLMKLFKQLCEGQQSTEKKSVRRMKVSWPGHKDTGAQEPMYRKENDFQTRLQKQRQKEIKEIKQIKKKNSLYFWDLDRKITGHRGHRTQIYEGNRKPEGEKVQKPVKSSSQSLSSSCPGSCFTN